MSKIEKHLKEWVTQGLISPDQANQIRDHESAKPESSWILTGLLILGAVIIGIGVISVIAANWDQIPDSLKLASDFLLLGLVGILTLRSWELKKSFQFETLLVLFLLLCLASIGLISQVFNTSGRLYEALMFWSFITFGVAMAARHIFVPFIWTGAFLIAATFTALESATLQPIFENNYQAVMMSVPFLCALLTIASKNLVGENGPTRAFRYWILIGGLVALIISEIEGKSYGFTGFLPGYSLAALTATGLWQGNTYRGIQKTLLLLAAAIFMIPFHLHPLGIEISVIYAALTITVLGLMAIFLASLGERRLFQWFLFFLGIRFLVLYFQALGGLAMTGAGLIVSGGLVIGMATLWNKHRKAITDWAEGWTK